MDFIPKKFYLDDIFNDFMPNRAVNNMKCDIYEKEGVYHIEMDVPGYKKEDISVNVEDGYLTIQAQKEETKEDNDKNYIRRERNYGEYKRSFYLGNLDQNKVEAEFKDGMLKITVPKKEENKNIKSIEIK